MVAARPRYRPANSRKIRTNPTPTESRLKRSYFFIGRQAASPFAYDRNAPPRPSNIMWLFQDDLDYEAHKRSYRQETVAFFASGLGARENMEVGQKRKRTTKSKLQNVGRTRFHFEGTIDLTVSDGEDEVEVVKMGSSRREKGKDGTRQGGAAGSLATFTTENGIELGATFVRVSIRSVLITAGMLRH